MLVVDRLQAAAWQSRYSCKYTIASAPNYGVVVEHVHMSRTARYATHVEEEAMPALTGIDMQSMHKHCTNLVLSSFALAMLCMTRVCYTWLQVNGGSQSFNVVNHLRTLGRWMRMVTIPNQSSVPKAWTEFDDDGCMKPSSYRERIVDVAEELFKFTMLLRDHSSTLVDRYSERHEIRRKGRLLTQAEKESSIVPVTDAGPPGPQ